VRNPCAVTTNVYYLCLIHEQNDRQNLYLWLQPFIKLYMDGMISQLEVIQIKTITQQNPPCLCQSIQHGNSLNTRIWAWLHSIHNVFSKLWLLIFSFTHKKNPDSLNIIYTLWKVFRCPRYHATLPSEFQKPYTPYMSEHFSYL
jgi:hypothetical protein